MCPRRGLAGGGRRPPSHLAEASGLRTSTRGWWWAQTCPTPTQWPAPPHVACGCSWSEWDGPQPSTGPASSQWGCRCWRSDCWNQEQWWPYTWRHQNARCRYPATGGLGTASRGETRDRQRTGSGWRYPEPSASRDTWSFARWCRWQRSSPQSRGDRWFRRWQEGRHCFEESRLQLLTKKKGEVFPEKKL